MARFFNTAGPCFPGVHYMVPAEARLPKLRRLVEQGAYFVVHAPRQSGKTTTLRLVAGQLSAEGQYAALYVSCEAGATLSGDAEIAVSTILHSIEHQAKELPESLRPPRLDAFAEQPPHSRLKLYLSAWCERSPLPVVLFLDEVDALAGDALLAVLRQLREGYSDRPRRFPHSLALIGLRDVRDYKIPLQPGLERLGTSSPFNIKVESLSLRNFTAGEVAALYAQHTAETGQSFSEEAAARSFELTRGQPWLVNALARQLVEELVPNKARPIEAGDVEAAKEVLILRRDTHLDSLIDRLREPRIQRVLEPILAGEVPGTEVSEEDIRFAEDLGLITREHGIEIANPIYREVIPRSLVSVTESYLPVAPRKHVDVQGHLLMDQLLNEFAAFWREHSESWTRQQAYPEVAAQLVFMAYLQRLINGGGFIDREYAVGSGRIDICVRWPLPTGGLERFAIELKVWRRGRQNPEPQGLEQLAGYLDRLGLESGTLLIFDQRDTAEGSQPERREVEMGGHRITVWRL